MTPGAKRLRRTLGRIYRAPRRAFASCLCRMGIPADLYVDGDYVCRGGKRIFPRANEGLLDIHPGVECHATFFNLQDRITIEEGVVFGHEVMFLTGGHEVGEEGVDPATSLTGPIVVRRGAWIASRAIILGGVTVGQGAVIGAGAVVTESVPNHELWAGNPAHFIRRVTQ